MPEATHGPNKAFRLVCDVIGHDWPGPYLKLKQLGEGWTLCDSQFPRHKVACRRCGAGGVSHVVQDIAFALAIWVEEAGATPSRPSLD